MSSSQSGRIPGVSDEEFAAALNDGGASQEAYPVSTLLARHWQSVFDYASLCSPSSKIASMLATAAFAQLLENLARNGSVGALRPHLLVTTRHMAKSWAGDQRITAMLPGLSIPEPPAENRQLVSRAFHAMPMTAQVLLWHAEAEAEGISVPAGLLGIDPRAASDQLAQTREQFRQTCVRVHREYAPTGECRHYNRLLDISLRRGGALIPDIQVHLSECAYCRYAADQLRQSQGRLGVLLAEALLGGAAESYLASRPGRRRHARLKEGRPGQPGAPGGRGTGRHSRRGRARAALPVLVLRGRRAAVEKATPAALGIGAAVAATGVLAVALLAALWSDEGDHAGPAVPSGAVTGTAPPASLAPPAPGASGQVPSAPTPSASLPPAEAPQPSATSAGHPSGPLTTRLRNVEADLCVDFAGGRAKKEVDVLMAACSSAPTQQWVYENDGRLRSSAAPELCLNSHGLDGIVVAGDCTGRSAPDAGDVRYDLTIQGHIVPRWNERLAVLPASTDPGSPVVVKVRDDSPGQIWATDVVRSGPTQQSAPYTEDVGGPPPDRERCVPETCEPPPPAGKSDGQPPASRPSATPERSSEGSLRRVSDDPSATQETQPLTGPSTLTPVLLRPAPQIPRRPALSALAVD
ncbi:ricin-type beta-trefoil lectin domain protein [Streptomyces sp. NPDC018833]|uniref:RICIN domain-containing protein n=1 Tax=Streptomyces sp. NPDC018833 TaxID=3365053 RepID=UPI00379C1228